MENVERHLVVMVQEAQNRHERDGAWVHADIGLGDARAEAQTGRGDSVAIAATPASLFTLAIQPLMIASM
jgi:hypothetical protein